MIHRVGKYAEPTAPRQQGKEGHPHTPVASVPSPELPSNLYDIDACYRYCEDLARSRHHNFPVGSFFVPTALRKHILAVYAFARTADDFADETLFEGRRGTELDAWEERLHRCYFGDPGDHPVFVALGDTIKKFDLPITEFTALLQGYRTDLEVHRYSTYADLCSYAALAAIPVGHLFLYLGGYRDANLLAYADDLATGLTGAKLCQDIARDLARGRIYIPAEDLQHFGISAADLQAGTRSPALESLIRFQVARTRSHFARARPLIEAVGPNMGIELALIYHGGLRILEKIQDVGKDILHERPVLHAADKAIVVSRALAWRGSLLRHRGDFVKDRLRAWLE